MRHTLGSLLAFCLVAGTAFAEPLQVRLHSTLPSPQPVGTPIGLTPYMEGAGRAMFVYQYAVSVNGGPFRIVRDFSQDPFFSWAPELMEQSAAIRVTVRNNGTKETAANELKFEIVSRVKGTAPVVNRTAHPLVALFSAPACAQGSHFRVGFQSEGEQSISRTPDQPCREAGTNNVYVAGMRADTDYRLRSELVAGNGSVKTGAWLPFHTGPVDGKFPAVSVVVPRTSPTPSAEPVLIYSAHALAGGTRPFATDLQGRMIWYLAAPDFLTRVLPGGRFIGLADGQNSVNSVKEEQLVREYDLAGNIVRETNAGRVAEQLESHGIHSDCRIGGKECVSGFHHEAIRLPNGHTLVIAGIERIMPAGTQGSKEPVDVLGDLVVDLDADFQVAGVWNSFDHLDLKRKSLKDAKCRTGGGGCPAVLLAPEANGWTHSNSLNYIPSTGDFVVSVPEQNWVIKVDWKNGKGSGKILWRLGPDGDFKVDAKDPNPWFSFQHDAGFEPVGSNILTITDDVFALRGKNDKAGVRAQAWKLDEDQHIATLIYNAETGVNTNCCGSTQLLKDGGYTTAAGWVAPMKGRTAETSKDGKVVLAIDVLGVIVYRSFRVSDMYSATAK